MRPGIDLGSSATVVAPGGAGKQSPLHAMARMAKGLMGILEVSGSSDARLMHAGPAGENSASMPDTGLSGMSPQDTAEALAGFSYSNDSTVSQNAKSVAADATADSMPGMNMGTPGTGAKPVRVRSAHAASKPVTPAPQVQPIISVQLDGCMVLLNDGRATLRTIRSNRIYRLEAQPLLFSEHANRLVHVTGVYGSVLPHEDASMPSFVVQTVDRLASDCSAKLSRTAIETTLGRAHHTVPALPGTVGMGDLSFAAPTITIRAGQKVTWQNSSQAVHNVVTDAGKATNPADVHVPVGETSFDSGYMQPGQSYTRVFKTPGTYRYVCTLHEGNGMKGVVVVK